MQPMLVRSMVTVFLAALWRARVGMGRARATEGHARDALDEAAAVVALHSRLSDALHASRSSACLWGVELCRRGRAPTTAAVSILRQFLRARDFDVDRTLCMIQKAIDWRQEFGIHQLRPDQFAGLADDVFITDAVGSASPSGPRASCAVWIRMGRINEDAFADVERFVRWRVCMHEEAMNQFILHSSPDRIEHGYLVVFDCAGLGSKHLSHKSRECICSLSRIMQRYYPDFVSGIQVVNAPGIFYGAWPLLRPFLPPAFVQSVALVSPDACVVGIAACVEATAPARITAGDTDRPPRELRRERTLSSALRQLLALWAFFSLDLSRRIRQAEQRLRQFVVLAYGQAAHAIALVHAQGAEGPG